MIDKYKDKYCGDAISGQCLIQSDNAQGRKYGGRRQGIAPVFHGNCHVLGVPAGYLHPIRYSDIIIAVNTLKQKAGDYPCFLHANKY